jgi:hypothetical protein
MAARGRSGAPNALSGQVESPGRKELAQDQWLDHLFDRLPKQCMQRLAKFGICDNDFCSVYEQEMQQ